MMMMVAALLFPSREWRCYGFLRTLGCTIHTFWEPILSSMGGVVASVHAVHYVSNYYSPVLCTIYPLYKIIRPKYMHILVERLQIHDYTGSIRHHYFAAILVHLLPLIPVLYLLKKWTTSSLAKK